MFVCCCFSAVLAVSAAMWYLCYSSLPRPVPPPDVFPLNNTWIGLQQALWVEGQGLTVLVVGRSGTGKLTLMNWLLGREDEENSMKSFNEKKPTDHLTVYSNNVTVNNVPLSLVYWNSPNKEDLASETIEGFDLIVYTLKMNDQRFKPKDTELLHLMGETFGASFFRRAVFVLTYANQVGSVENNKFETSREILADKVAMWRKAAEQVAAVPVRVVPAGHFNKPKLFGKHWPTEVLKAFLSKLEDVDYPSFLKICGDLLNY